MSSARASVLLLLAIPTIVAGVGAAATPTTDESIEAAFRQRSAAPGETVTLDVWSRVRDLRVTVHRVGPGGAALGQLSGPRVATLRPGSTRPIAIEVGSWRTGVYSFLTPPLLRWRLTTASGRVVQPWRVAVDHRLTIPTDDRYSTQYARWTRQNKRNRPGRYRFVLRAGWDSRDVADGPYAVEVAASDLSGNRTIARFPLRVANDSARV